MINGSIYMTCDRNLAMQFIANNPQQNVIVCISQNVQQDPQFLQSTGALLASVLTPPYEAFMMEVQGDANGFAAVYYEHLNKKECAEYIASILKAITIGKNIMLYMTPDEYQTSYASMFRAYMLQTFGICIGDQSIEFSWFQNQFINVALTLYLFDLYTYKELFDAWKVVPMVNLPEYIILKLVNELAPTAPDGYTIQDWQNLFLTMAIGYNGKQLEIPARVVKK